MKILSIDFDIIMKPSIEAYNNLIDGHQPDKSIGAYCKEFPFFSCLPADLDIYSVLTKYLKDIPKEKRIFITDHREAFGVVRDHANGVPVSLINIDHHHDIAYHECPLTPNAADGNWVKCLYDNNLIQDYTWIRNNNSHMPYDWVQEQFPDVEYLYFEKELLNEIKPDLVVICLSPNWVPKMYYPLYDLWKSI